MALHGKGNSVDCADVPLSSEHSDFKNCLCHLNYKAKQIKKCLPQSYNPPAVLRQTTLFCTAVLKQHQHKLCTTSCLNSNKQLKCFAQLHPVLKQHQHKLCITSCINYNKQLKCFAQQYPVLKQHQHKHCVLVPLPAVLQQTTRVFCTTVPSVETAPA